MDLSRFDPNSVAIASALIGAVVGAAISLVVSELRARGRERREVDRAREADHLEAERLREAENRQALLTAIEHTQRMLAGLMADLTATAAGPGAQPAGRYSYDVNPKNDLALVGDVQALTAYFDVARDLAAREPGSGLRVLDGSHAAIVEFGVHTALEAQAERVRTGAPIVRLGSADLAAVGDSLHAVVAAIASRPRKGGA
jgi:hypothetical protein